MPTAKKAAKKKKAPPPKDARPQSERFLEAAKAAGVDEEAVERAMGKLLKPQKTKR